MTSSKGTDITLFTEVDRTAEPDFYVRFLTEGNALPSIRAAKPIIIGGLSLTGSEHVLELGCGTGDDAIALAQLVTPKGRVIGVDISETMIAEARRQAAGLGLPLTFETGDAQSLRFTDGAFDAVRCERMLMHVVDVEAALAEMVRVTRPGGRISVFDFDWDTMVIDSPHQDTTRAIVRGFSDGIRHGWIGRQLRRRLHEHGLADLSIHAHQVFLNYDFTQLLLGGFLTTAQQAGQLDPSAVAAWWQALLH
jgi:SAM-dependent methyltransferase